MSIIYFLIVICNIYVTIMSLWYFFPTGIMNLKYTIKGENIRDLKGNKGNLYIVDHRENPFVDILIMSNECRKIKNKNKNYLVSAGSQRSKIINYLPKITPYEVLNITDGDTVKKCIDLINNNNNVIIFISNEVSKKTGIYYILKETKTKAIMVKKKIENIKYTGWEDRILDIFGKKQEITYTDYKYNLNLTPQDFMKELITILFFTPLNN